MGHHEVEYRGHPTLAQLDGRYSPAQHPAALAVADIEPGQVHGQRLRPGAILQTENRADIAEV